MSDKRYVDSVLSTQNIIIICTVGLTKFPLSHVKIQLCERKIENKM